MDFLQAIGNLVSLAVFALIAAGVVKAFQVANDLGEIKDILRDIRRNAVDQIPPSPGEQNLRDMDEASYLAALQRHIGSNAQHTPAPSVSAIQPESDLSAPALEPEIVSPPGHWKP